MYGLAGLRSTLEIFRVQLNLNFAATRCMCSSITEIKREMCRCPLVYVLFLKGACNWDVLGQFFFIHCMSRYTYSFYWRFLPLFCYYRYIISLQESSLISVVLIKFDFTLIVWKENAKKCASLSEVFFLLLRPVAYFIFSLSSSLSSFMVFYWARL